MTPKQLIAARNALGMSQTGLAKALDLSVRQISGMETGEREISQVIALALSGLKLKNS